MASLACCTARTYERLGSIGQFNEPSPGQIRARAEGRTSAPPSAYRHGALYRSESSTSSNRLMTSRNVPVTPDPSMFFVFAAELRPHRGGGRPAGPVVP